MLKFKQFSHTRENFKEIWGDSDCSRSRKSVWVIVSRLAVRRRSGCPSRDLVVELTWILLKPPLCLLAEGVPCRTDGTVRAAADTRGRSLLTVVAVVQPDSVAVVLAVAFHGVVAEVALRHLVVGIDDDLQGGRRHFRDVGVTDVAKLGFSCLPEKCSCQV